MQRSTVLNGAPDVASVGVVASDGAIIFPDELAQTLSWNSDSTLAYIQVVVPATPGTNYAGGTYRQTFTYTSGLVTGVSVWTKQ